MRFLLSGHIQHRIVTGCILLSRRYDPFMVTEQADSPERPGGHRTGNAFLLAQLGAHAAARFAERIAAIGLKPAQAGLLRLVAWEPGQSQQALATRLGTPPSRLVPLVDELEERGLIERRRDSADRRHYALYLTDDGGQYMKQLGQIGAAHEDDICAPLSRAERSQLHDLLSRLAGHQGLSTGVHPGYRSGSRPRPPA
jgi:DNA-binding MarR family transcriptional regulator